MPPRQRSSPSPLPCGFTGVSAPWAKPARPAATANIRTCPRMVPPKTQAFLRFAHAKSEASLTCSCCPVDEPFGLRPSGLGRAQDPHADGARHRVAAVLHAHLAQDLLDVVLDRIRADIEDACDIEVGLAVADPAQDLGFAAGDA